jgi:hypothetical protein
MISAGKSVKINDKGALGAVIAADDNIFFAYAAR